MRTFLADFVFSSSPAEVVYLIPDQTIAPMAKRAPNERTRLAIVTTRAFTHSLSAHLSTPTASLGTVDAVEQSVRKAAALPPAAGSHSAKVGTKIVREKRDTKMTRINRNIIL